MISITFTTVNFIFLFLPLTLACYYLLRGRARDILLLAASLLFYALGEPRMVLLLAGSIAVNYVFGLLLGALTSQAARRLFVVLMLAFNVGLLFYYKYFIFTVTAINDLFQTGLALPQIVQPLGISFFTFRTISFCLDVYWGTVPVQKDPIDMALYVSFFPQVSMGPISKFNEFAAQLGKGRRPFDADLFLGGIRRFILGLARKLIIADNLGKVVDAVFAMDAGSRSVALSWIGILGYIIQLYYDFAGYSDMAVGIGQMLGFRTPENFNYPFLSKTVAEYWNRWHITLGTWLKNYVYTPIFRSCLDRNIPKNTGNILALMGVWLIAGIWHGAGWNYLCYGLYYFAFIAAERLIEDCRKKRRKKLGLKKQPQKLYQRALSHLYFFAVLIFGQLLFRCADLPQFGAYAGSLFGCCGNALADKATLFYWRQSALLLLVGIVLSFPVIPWIEGKMERTRGGSLLIGALRSFIYGLLLVVSLAFAMTSTYQSFIYFQF